MSHSCIYGLWLSSNHPIPGVAASTFSPRTDLEIRLGSMPPCLDAMLKDGEVWYTSSSVDECGRPGLVIWKLLGGAYLRLCYSDGTEFLVDRSGERLWASWPERATLEDTATYLLGPVMGIVLLLRGTHSLHASAVAVGSRAIALVGPQGAGKSTTAAAFARLGYAVLSDDVVALVERRNQFFVQPAYPRIRLWPESVTTLYGKPDALPRLTPTWDKRYLDLSVEAKTFQPDPLPLAAIYILGERRDYSFAPSVESLTANTALMGLVANTYTTHLLGKQMRAEEFKVLARLRERVPLRRVIPHADSAYLTRLCEVILDDFDSLSSCQ